MILYFSGTGNSLSIAKALGAQLDEKIVSIHDALQLSSISDTVIGFVFPVHNYDMPRFVKEAISQLHFTNATYIFAIITHGGDKGNALYSVQELMAAKSLPLNYTNDVLMPVNSRIMYGRVTDKIEERITASAIKAESIAADIKNRSQMTNAVSRKGFFYFLHNIVENHSIRARFTPMIKVELCVNCGICAKVCPSNNISVKDGKAFIKDDCHQCTNCLHWCPQVAIHYKKRDVRKAQQYHFPTIKMRDVSVR